MKKNMIYLLTGCFTLVTALTFAQVPVPDFNFGNNGLVFTDIAGNNDVANDIVMQPDGKFIVAGNGLVQSHNQFMIMRYHVNGVVDSSFGVNGKATIAISPIHNYARAVALQPDGSIVVAGYYDFNFDDRAVVVRFDSTGLPDPAFGNNGIVQFSTTTDIDGFNDVVIRNDGKIIVTGRKYSNNSYNYFIMQLNSNGTPDNGFGTNGKVETDFQGFEDYIYSVVLQPDGKILVAGASGPSASYFSAARFHPDGSPDLSFGTGGKVLIGSGSRLDVCTGLAVNSDGTIILAGNHHDSSTDEYMFVKLTASGALVPNFGTNGIQMLPTSHPTNLLRDIQIQSDGKIVAVGSGAGRQAIVMRIHANGMTDVAFGTQGIFACGASTSGSMLNAVLMLGDSVLVGCGFSDQSSNEDYLVMKAWVQGTTGVAPHPGNDSGMSIYPNPATDHITVSLEQASDHPVQVEIFDALGKRVQTGVIAAGSREARIPLPASVSKGMGWVRLRNQQLQWVEELVVQ